MGEIISWLFGIVCGIIICIASVPFTVSYARYQAFDLKEAYTYEVQKTIPYALREYLKDKPWHAFAIKYFKAQTKVEEFGAEKAGEAIKNIVSKNDYIFYYALMYFNIVLPQQFKQFHAEPLVELLGKGLG